MKILVMGLSGSGKTFLSKILQKELACAWYNADNLREMANDWDFSEEGRKRQARRMSDAAIKIKKEGNNVIADFICPTPAARELFPADYIIWVDTIKEGRFEDTNQMFVKPEKFNFHVTTQDAKLWASKIKEDLN